jgi:hypothetical protein
MAVHHIIEFTLFVNKSCVFRKVVINILVCLKNIIF